MASNFRAGHSRNAWQDFLGFTREEIAPIGPIRAVVSRAGQTEPFNAERIKEALMKTIEGVRGQADPPLVLELSNAVARKLLEKQLLHPGSVPG